MGWLDVINIVMIIVVVIYLLLERPIVGRDERYEDDHHRADFRS